MGFGPLQTKWIWLEDGLRGLSGPVLDFFRGWGRGIKWACSGRLSVNYIFFISDHFEMYDSQNIEIKKSMIRVAYNLQTYRNSKYMKITILDFGCNTKKNCKNSER